METAAFGIENLCVPCACRCRYCLLSYDGHPVGVEYVRGRELARRIIEELRSTRPGLQTFYYIGCSMETPELPDYISFCRETGSPSGDFLQLNGMACRSEEQARELMRTLYRAGIRTVDMTFYGTPEYHDRFAGRMGDFALLTRLLDAAGEAGIGTRVSMPVTRGNTELSGRLLELLSSHPVGQFFAFLPHAKGRGAALEPERLTRAEFEALPAEVRGCFSPKVEYRAEGDWLRAGQWPAPNRRTLTLSLIPGNIDRLEKMSAEDIVAMVEAMDDEYYGAIPAPAELARLYGDPEGDRMYRLRNLLILWRRRFRSEYPGDIPDMDDERGSFSVRV